jgi:hypothetical protein
MPLISSGVVKGRRCPICGAEHTSCGLPYQGNAVAIPEEPTVADPHDLYIYQDKDGHTFQMTEADAREPGYTRVGSQTAAVADQERAAESEATVPDLTTDPDATTDGDPPVDPDANPDADPDSKAQAPAANKARQSGENK